MEPVKAKVVEVVERPKMPTLWAVAVMLRLQDKSLHPCVLGSYKTLETAQRAAVAAETDRDYVGTIRIIEIAGEA
jgi:hypothetical protein